MDDTYFVLSVGEREEEVRLEDAFVLPERDELFADDVRVVLLLDEAGVELFVRVVALCPKLGSGRVLLIGKRGVSLSS